MARAKRAGDEATKARKRYYRAAERYLDKSKTTSGATASKYRQLAKQNFEDALSTYQPTNKQRFSQPMQFLANEFGFDLSRYMSKIMSMPQTKRENMAKKARETISESASVLESRNKTADIRRQREARALLSNDVIGSRIMGGFVDIWKDEAVIEDPKTMTLKVDNSKIMSKIFEFFDVDTEADLIDKIEEIVGDRLYAEDSNSENYDTVKLIIQNTVVERILAA